MTFEISTFVFIGAALILFYISAPKYKAAVLSAASLLFCFRLEPYALAVMLFVTILSYLAGMLLGKMKETGGYAGRTVLGAYAGLSVMLLIGWEYLYAVKGNSLVKYAVPIGLSFYTIQSVSYVCDVYNKRLDHEKKPDRYLLYMSWFPKLISGPIERGSAFFPQVDRLEDVRLFEEPDTVSDRFLVAYGIGSVRTESDINMRFIDEKRIVRALSYIIWGLFMKLMIADRAGIIVDAVFARTEEFGGLMLVLGSFLYTIQLYCDFAGYSDIAIGVSSLFGIELTQNFKNPYFSENITEFWRKWHITLSSFLRDYVYIPLGGNRKGRLRKWINTMIVFLLCGIWHGIGLSFAAWGLLHGFYSVAADLIRNTRLDFILRGAAGRVLTFCCVSFAWIFFRAETLRSALGYISSVFSHEFVIGSFTKEINNADSSLIEIIILAAAMLIMFIFDLVALKKNDILPEVLVDCTEIKRDAVFFMLAVVILIFGIYGNLEVKDFIYMKF